MLDAPRRPDASLDEAIASIITRTRQFAVRQERWFRRDPRIRWIDVEHDPVAGPLAAVIAAFDTMTALALTKHHGLGNDFLVVFDPDVADRLPPCARPVCATGGPASVPTGCSSGRAAERRTTAIGMTLYNADGSRAEMSGNGIRCLAQALAQRAGDLAATADPDRCGRARRRTDGHRVDRTRSTPRVEMGDGRATRPNRPAGRRSDATRSARRPPQPRQPAQRRRRRRRGRGRPRSPRREGARRQPGDHRARPRAERRHDAGPRARRRDHRGVRHGRLRGGVRRRARGASSPAVRPAKWSCTWTAEMPTSAVTDDAPDGSPDRAGARSSAPSRSRSTSTRHPVQRSARRHPDRPDDPGEDRARRRHHAPRRRRRHRGQPRRARAARRHRRRRRGRRGWCSARLRPTPPGTSARARPRSSSSCASPSTPTPSCSTTSSRPAQQYNLEKLLGRTALDRTAVILDIFGQNAHTLEGKAQVELALLRYRLPRLRRGADARLSQQRGGIGARFGGGETKLEVDRRRIMRRINKLERELRTLARDAHAAAQGPRPQRPGRRGDRRLHERRQVSAAQPADGGRRARRGPAVRHARPDHAASVAARWRARAADRHRRLRRRLPHGLVEAFKSTLEVAALAD